LQREKVECIRHSDYQVKNGMKQLRSLSNAVSHRLEEVNNSNLEQKINQVKSLQSNLTTLARFHEERLRKLQEDEEHCQRTRQQLDERRLKSLSTREKQYRRDCKRRLPHLQVCE
jgi:hypothetical protein